MQQKILIVEDDRVIRNLVIHHLKHHLKNIDFEEVRDGLQAVDRMLLNGVDLIVMDLRMPKMDGIEAIKHIRQFSSDIPIIVLSAYDDDRHKSAAKAAGATRFFRKPPDYLSVATTIKSLLKYRPAKTVLQKWHATLNKLLSQEAKYGGFPPVSLTNRIEDARQKIAELENEIRQD